MIRWLVWAVVGLFALGIVFRFLGSEEPKAGATSGAQSAPPRPAAVDSVDTFANHDYSESNLKSKFVKEGKLQLPKGACDHDRAMYDDAARYVDQGVDLGQALSLARRNAYERDRQERVEKRERDRGRAMEQKQRVAQRRDEVKKNRTWTPRPEPFDPALHPSKLGPPVVGFEEEEKKP